ncbi:DUF2442 domain-containing protein [Corynebacterium godavarianum]|uniref:DUF2442 domain-containing protein n=1 Tax=Corynebacterium godavarianum TaxID=2054421 RepID=A0ABY3DZV4_9CORY|nr:DUF2442 domain-containing protein [Corynebacterium godavarianum]MBL7286883.1 DUF2442 domain-containing protein [Corynebacterium godavarianum]TSJ72865.1 DUF2442 domain-containing protein [Corynebacterium godavarianum]
MQRRSIWATTVALAGALTACGTSESEPTTETVEQSAEQQAEQSSQEAKQESQQGAELPASISGYSEEARSDMAEDGLTEADVQGVLDAAKDGRAEVEFDDEHWELEFNDIDVDITPDGLVTEADR